MMGPPRLIPRGSEPGLKQESGSPGADRGKVEGLAKFDQITEGIVSSSYNNPERDVRAGKRGDCKVPGTRGGLASPAPNGFGIHGGAGETPGGACSLTSGAG